MSVALCVATNGIARFLNKTAVIICGFVGWVGSSHPRKPLQYFRNFSSNIRSGPSTLWSFMLFHINFLFSMNIFTANEAIIKLYKWERFKQSERHIENLQTLLRSVHPFPLRAQAAVAGTGLRAWALEHAASEVGRILQGSGGGRSRTPKADVFLKNFTKIMTDWKITLKF